MNKDIQDILQQKIGNLELYLRQLATYVSLDTDAILTNPDKLLSMERAFQLTVDEAVDITTTVAYQLAGKIPESYKSSFYELVPLGIIDDEFAMRISESARIRNQLIHNYDKLSRKDTIQSIKKFFEMYEKYTRILIEKFVTPTDLNRIKVVVQEQ